MNEGLSTSENIQSREAVVQAGVREALAQIAERYEQPNETGDGENVLSYHSAAHTWQKLEQVNRILSTLAGAGVAIRTEDRENAELATAFHDFHQLYAIRENPGTGIRERVMQSGFAESDRTDGMPGSERLSAEECVLWMHEMNRERGIPLFSEYDAQAVTSAIAATYAPFDPAAGTVRQPHLSTETPLIGWALAMADIGNAGMESPEVFIREGDALYREKYPGVEGEIERLPSLSGEQKEALRFHMLAWAQNQVRFAAGRKKAFAEDLKRMPLPEGVRENALAALQELFGGFDATIAALERVYAEREKLSLSQLAQRMGYHIPHEI